MDAVASAAAPLPDTPTPDVTAPTRNPRPGVPGLPGVPRAVTRSDRRDASVRAWLMWTAAVTVYFVAVFNRSSLGVAGLSAEHRFGIQAAALSTFSMLQMVVYASMQIPVGVLIDRFGPRRMLLAGLSVMCLAQACFAAVSSFGLALAARGLLGCGDAMVFISVLRIVAAWFPVRRVPLLTQLTSLAGAAGGIAATWPLAWALRALGWSGTFLAIAAIGACVLVLPIGVVRDAPRPRPATPDTAPPSSALPSESPAGTCEASVVTFESPAPPSQSPAPPSESSAVPASPASAASAAASPAKGRVRAQMRAAWSRPQTRLGLWIHFTTGFPAMVFSLLWGYPFLVQGEGLGAGLASALLTLLICVNMACCFGFGVLLTRSPEHRVALALGVVGVTAACLAAVLAWPGRAPLWLLVVLVCAYATNGAGSMIGFDVARTANPPERLGTASGMVNVGAFLACGITLLATGTLVDATGAGHAATAAAALSGYKTAFCFPFVLLALGSFRILRLSRLARADAVRQASESPAARVVTLAPVAPAAPAAPCSAAPALHLKD